MRYLAIASIEKIEATKFQAINFYDDLGYLVDQIISPFENPQQVIDSVKTLSQEYHQTVDLWTSDREIFTLALMTPGINSCEIKRPDDVVSTGKAVQQFEEVLRDLYEITPIVPLPELPNWRQKLYLFFVLLTYKIGGSGNYEI
jgi:hypothetical protein